MAIGDSTLKEAAGNLVMAGGKITGLAAGTTAGDAVRYEQAGLIDGTNAWTADQAMGTHKLTGLSQGTAAGHSVRYEDNYNELRFGATIAQASTTTVWASPAINAAYIAAEANAVVLMGQAGTIRGLLWFCDVTLSTDDVALTVRVNKADTSVTGTFTHGTTSGSTLGTAVTYSAGDRISLKAIQSSTQAGTSMAPRFVILYSNP